MKVVRSLENLKKQARNFYTGKNSILMGIEALGILLGVGYLFYDNVLAGLIFFPYIFIHVKNRKRNIIIKQKMKVAIAFKDGMQAVTSALSAGYSIENAFREALGELGMLYGKKTVIYSGFSGIVRELSINVNIEDAFSSFAKKCQIEEITSFSEILFYAKRSGGNLINIIKDSTNTISEKIDVNREITTIISAKRLEQNVMNLVPVGIILYMRLTFSGTLNKLYGNIFGITVMTICLFVYYFAKILADRIVNIKV